ncbi:hypothetical protein HX791_09050 [Pseudomonas costantinii]|nr:hypothetical protein [Pseudomonas costantinii]
MRLALDHQLSPEQMGALKFLVEKRLVGDALEHVRAFSKVVADKGVKVTPMPQGFYLGVINQLSGGECAGISHLLSLAVAAGKEHIFLGNIFQALADPDAPESQAFFKKLTEVHRQVTSPDVAHDPATMKLAPYTSIVPQLIGSPTTKTLLISSYGHRITAGVIVDPQGQRTYYYCDPNIGFTTFSSKESFEKGLKRIFAHSDLKYLLTPVNQDNKNPLYKISVFNREHLPAISGTSNDIKYMYSAPISGLDTVKVIDVSRVPSPENLRAQGPAPSGAESGDYESVMFEMEKMHGTKGMSQFHKAVNALKTVRRFMENHPNGSLFFRMASLEQKLIGVINEARAPVDYPYAFERIEQQRAYLAEDKLGGHKRYQGTVIQGIEFYTAHEANIDPGKSKSVTDAITAAMLKLQQSDPKTVQSLGSEINVIVAKPGDQPETQLSLGRPPTLIIGDDFFTSPSVSDGTVADRMGRQAQSNGGAPTAAKQEALLVGKFGMLGYYNADSVGFLEVVTNKEPYRDGGTELSARATKSPGDFMEEAYTARLYNGSLDSHTRAALGRLFSPAVDASIPDTTQTPRKPVAPPALVVTAPTMTVAPIDEAELKRLQALDATRPPIRIGELEVSRAELYRMGVHVKGKPVESVLATDSKGHITSDLEIDYNRFQAYLKSTSPEVGARMTSVVSEIAAKRSPGAAPLITRSDGGLVPDVLQASIRETSQHAAAIRDQERSGKPLPADFFSPHTSGEPGGKTRAAGLGFQAFSTFQGLRSSIESLQRGDTTAGVIGLGAVASDYVGMGVEAGLNQLAQKAINNVAPTIFGFKASSIGKMIGKVGGGAGLAISVPFDIYNAVNSFKKAAGSTGKEAQDHYVNGAFSVANAATSLALGAAYLTGASAAGPAGLVVAAVLMTTQAIYSAVRTVEDINKYTPLTGSQKFTTGLKSFLGFEPGFDVMKPYLEAKYAEAYDEQKRTQHEAFLKGPGKDYFERVVFGSGDVVVTQVPGKVGLTGQHWWSPITYLLNLIKVDGKVTSVSVTGGNDRINAPTESWNGMSIKPVEGTQGQGRATLWDLGDGNDEVAGVFTKPNYFLLGGGKKLISGGEVDDTVVFNADARQTLEQVEQVWDTERNGFSNKATELWGGEGRNTLTFSGSLSTTYTEGKETKKAEYSGHVINFKSGSVSVNTLNSKTEGVTTIAYFHEFSNAVTVENGESYIVGDDQSDLFTLNGKKDVVLTGKGSNVVVINGGASVVGEGGTNTYIINKGDKGVTIKDPNDSVIKLDYNASQVTGWSVSPSGDLTVTLRGDAPGEERKLVIEKAFSNDSKDDKARPTFITNDGVMMTINAPRQAGSSTRIAQVSSLKVEDGKPQT